MMDIARIHIRFYGANSFIRGQTMINWVTDFNMFGQYKRMWWPTSPMSEFMKLDEDRLNIIKPRAFVTITPVGIGLAGRSGDMDEAIANRGLEAVVKDDMPALMSYARKHAPSDHERITEIAFLTAFTKMGNQEFKLQGLVHTDARLIPAITQI
ncbi:MAG: hypothetical protein NTW69_13635 [Chloroflexi bacterium]|nr:hypothetical protein [Chloroflexota bacterium]